ncbi:MAG: hypothetical protein M3P51_06795, partial [Chloroflexota bacterium]|nr:hypothetical protein [Chloroflexota bacterium]
YQVRLDPTTLGSGKKSMEDFGLRVAPHLMATVFSLLIFSIVIFVWSARGKRLSGRASRNLAFLGVSLFIALVPTLQLTLPHLSTSEVFGFASWVTVSVVGSGIAIWLRYS